MLNSVLLSTSDHLSDLNPGFPAAQAAHAAVSARLGPAINENIVASTLKELISLAEDFTEKQKSSDPPPAAIMCRAGCSHCCHIRVLVTPPEVILLSQFIRDTFSEDELHKLMERLTVADSITHGMSDDEHGSAHVRCPLLVNDRCSVYAARPLECRGYVSMDVESCRNTFNNYADWDVPVFLPQYSIYKHVQAGLIFAWQAVDIRVELLELTAALHIALQSPNFVQRWLGGEDVFEAATLSPLDPECQALQPWTPTFGASTT